MTSASPSQERWIANPPGYGAGSRVRQILAEGRGSLGLMLVGEAGGEQEEKDGLPFRPWAEAGSILERVLYRAGIDRQGLTITNLVPYRPPRNWLDGAPWEMDALSLGGKFLAQDIARARPKAILALGTLPFRELTGLSGEKCGISMTRGFVVPGISHRGPDGRPLPIIGTFHPSFLRRGSKERQESGAKGKVAAAAGGTQGMSLLGVVIRDLLLAAEVARNGSKTFIATPHVLGAGLSEWRQALGELKADPSLGIFYDFETMDSLVADDESEMEIVQRNVTQVQIRYGRKILVSDWFPELLPVLREMIELRNTKIDWNGRKFDRPILRDMRIRCDLGRWIDGMDYWHHAQPDLPRGLQFAGSFFCPEVGPWKHLNASDPHWYGLLDVDVLARIVGGLDLSLQLAKHPISNVSLREGHEEQVVALAPGLDKMSARGIPVDNPKRLELDKEFTLTLEALEREMQGMVPEELRNISPKEGYVKTPRELMGECAHCDPKGKVLAEVLRKNGRPAMKKIPCPECGGKKWSEPEGIPDGWCVRTIVAQVKCGCAWGKKGKALALPEDCPRCGNSGKVEAREKRFAKVLPFLPGSWQQVLRYLEHMRAQDIQERMASYSAKHPGLESLARAHAEDKTAWKIPIDHKTGRPTTAEGELKRLGAKTEDPLIPKILDFREIDKARGTYVRGWAPGADGRVHPGFGFKPATGQLSCVAPWTPVNVLGRGFPAIQDVKVGDQVWTHQRRWKKVTRQWCKGVEQMFEVHFSDGQVLTCTDDHRLLIYPHECLQAMGYTTREHPCGFGDLQISADAGGGRDSEEVEGLSAYGRLDSANAYPPGGVCRAQGHTLFPVEDRGEESGIWKNAAELHRDCGRWVRVFDLREGWQAAVSASADPSEGVEDEVSTPEVRRALYRRESTQQRFGQSGAGYQTWTSRNSLPAGEGYAIITIAKIHPVGSHEVYDITVEDDHSYSACGVFSHNSEEPNAQNFPAHGALAKKMKAMICVPPARRIVVFDYKSFHVLTLGFEAKDPKYMRLARLDMHSYFALVGLLRLEKSEKLLELPDEELKSVLKFYRVQGKSYPEFGGATFQQIRDEKAKRAILGIGFGQQEFSLWKLNPESFAGTAEARLVLDRLNGEFPLPEAWRWSTRMKADEDHQLLSRYGYVRHFWDVFHRKPVAENYQPRGGERVWMHKSGQRWLLKPGDDHESCIAFLPANDAFGMIRSRMVELHREGLDDRFGLMNQIHDSLVFDCSGELVEECLHEVRARLQAPSAVLVDPDVAPGGLWCAVEAKVGQDLAGMEEV